MSVPTENDLIHVSFIVILAITLSMSPSAGLLHMHYFVQSLLSLLMQVAHKKASNFPLS